MSRGCLPSPTQEPGRPPRSRCAAAQWPIEGGRFQPSLSLLNPRGTITLCLREGGPVAWPEHGTLPGWLGAQQGGVRFGGVLSPIPVKQGETNLVLGYEPTSGETRFLAAG